LPLFGLEPSPQGPVSNLWLSSNRITLLHWTLNLGHSSKVTLSFTLFESCTPPKTMGSMCH
jgi:hypothetical protein